MKKTIVAIAAAFAGLLFTSCEKIVGTGPVVTELRNASNFTGVSSEFSGKVNIHTGNSFKVEATAQQNILDVLHTDVINGVLHIDFADNVNIRTHQDVMVSITMPLLDYLRLSGSGNVDVVGTVAAGSFDTQLSGSGIISIQDLQVNGTLDARISGSGNMYIYNGSTTHEKLQVSGSGSINFSNLAASTAEAVISGSGNIKLKAEQSLDAFISGSGSVYYTGDPLVTAYVSGSGKVKKM